MGAALKTYRLFLFWGRGFRLPPLNRSAITTMMHSATMGVRMSTIGSCVRAFSASATFCLKFIVLQFTGGTCNEKNRRGISKEYHTPRSSQSITSASVPVGSAIGQRPSCIFGWVNAVRNNCARLKRCQSIVSSFRSSFVGHMPCSQKCAIAASTRSIVSRWSCKRASPPKRGPEYCATKLRSGSSFFEMSCHLIRQIYRHDTVLQSLSNPLN
jgi:hypothetical protein